MFGQKNTPPSVAALLFSTEGLFAAVAKCIVKRTLPAPIIVLGSALMFVGIIFSQLPHPKQLFQACKKAMAKLKTILRAVKIFNKKA